ncbi:hypothetical protein L484_005546 [Morus notabilis]|uniref:Uncharacterized protein n=1 Tax=Morus notabilis TaxID=981085 RepID=W9RCE4_9ROSA|nr:hypothetical protein L484_005546 [Morus notabilis]
MEVELKYYELELGEAKELLKKDLKLSEPCTDAADIAQGSPPLPRAVYGGRYRCCHRPWRGLPLLSPSMEGITTASHDCFDDVLPAHLKKLKVAIDVKL